MSVNHSQLRAFHHVANEGSFTRAAQALGVSQPTLSAQVKALEDGYGVRLFDRRGRRIALTPLAQDLLAVTEQVFALEGEAEALLSGIRDPARGALAIGTESPHHAMTFLAGLKTRHDGLVLSVSVGGARSVLRDLREYRCDVAVLSNPPDAPDLFAVPFRRDRLVAIAPASEPEGDAPIPLSLLLERRLILREAGSVTRDVLQAAAAARGLKLRPHLEIGSREAIREAVVAGLGVGVVFESEFGRDAGLRRIKIAGADLTVRYAVVCLENRCRLATIRAAMAVAEMLADPAAM
ncbi:MAG: LysR substrate-binding domain-containing protein [Alphaproteobacteria bacterium]|nr:LysR substrate-binding domain-containing protein [Alphaproteobacteria bacterium]